MIRRDVLGLRVEIRPSHPGEGDWLGRWLAGFPAPEAEAPEVPGVRGRLTRTAQGWLLHTPSFDLGPASRQGLLVQLVDRLTDALAASSRYLLTHAGALERDGEALLLPGGSHAGKTSLTAALLARGFRLLGDEVGALTFDGAAVPCPLPLQVRESVRGELDPVAAGLQWLGEAFAHRDETARLALPSPAQCAPPGRYPVRWVVHPRLEWGAPTRLTDLGRGEAALHLLGAVWNGPALGSAGVEAAARLAERCESATLRSGCLPEAADRLATRFDALRADPARSGSTR